MPIPFGHWGQPTSAPSTGPCGTGVGRSGTVIVGVAGTLGVTAFVGGGEAGAPGLLVVAGIDPGAGAGVGAGLAWPVGATTGAGSPPQAPSNGPATRTASSVAPHALIVWAGIRPMSEDVRMTPAHPTTIPHGRTARRLDWAYLPPMIRRAVEKRLGSAVVEAESQGAGFTPGFASVLTCAD